MVFELPLYESVLYQAAKEIGDIGDAYFGRHTADRAHIASGFFQGSHETLDSLMLMYPLASGGGSPNCILLQTDTSQPDAKDGFYIQEVSYSEILAKGGPSPQAIEAIARNYLASGKEPFASSGALNDVAVLINGKLYTFTQLRSDYERLKWSLKDDPHSPDSRWAVYSAGEFYLVTDSCTIDTLNGMLRPSALDFFRNLLPNSVGTATPTAQVTATLQIPTATPTMTLATPEATEALVASPGLNEQNNRLLTDVLNIVCPIGLGFLILFSLYMGRKWRQ